MILSNTAIHEALTRGWLVIDPEPAPRFPEVDRPCPYQTSAVDLRLGSEIAWLNEGLPVSIDLRKGGFADLFGPNSESRFIHKDQPYVLNPNKYVLARTLERIELPLVDDGPCLAARMEGRSSYARCGLLVHFTAPTIHAGFAGAITLEIVNLGPYPIQLHAGAFICQLIIEQVSGIPFRNDSQFQGQSSVGGSVAG